MCLLSDMRDLAVKTAAMFLLVILCFPNDAVAGFKKKVAIEPFQNPANWAGLYDPGVLLAEMIKSKIVADGSYRIVSQMAEMKPGEDKEEPKPIVEMMVEPTKVTDAAPMQEKAKMEEKPSSVARELIQPGQVVVIGRILTLQSKTLTSGKGKNPLVEELAELEAEVTLLNPKNNRVFAVKKFKADAKREKQKATEPPVLNDPSFLQSSTGAVMESFAKNAYMFFNEVLSGLPFEADIIGVDEKTNEVIINVGANDGVRVFDTFSVYHPVYSAHKPMRYYRDPLSHTDLGDLLMPMGIIKATDVQGNVARAQILAGAEIKTGNLVHMRQAYSIKRDWRDLYSK